MIGESIAIIAVLVVTAFTGLRTGKKGLAKITLPFLCMPVCVLLGEALFLYLSRSFGTSYYPVRMSAVLVGASLGGALCVAAGRAVPSRIRGGFIVICLVFIVLMALAYALPIL
jgi:hypothetical protein